MSSFGLGRGLDALIAKKPQPTGVSSSPSVLSDTQSTFEISVDIIRANDYQPRTEFATSDLAELAQSIRDYGILQPLVVSRVGNEYRLIAGERRLRAAKQVGLRVVPVVVRDADEHQRLALALIENIQRVNLNPLELAVAYKKLKDEFNLTQEEISKRVGKSRSAVANFLRILNLPDRIQQALREGMISEGMSRVLLSIQNESEQLSFFDHIMTQQLTVDEAVRQVRSFSSNELQKKQPRDSVMSAKEELLREYLGTRVSIQQKGKRGVMHIDFYSQEELDEVIRKIIHDVMITRD